MKHGTLSSTSCNSIIIAADIHLRKKPGMWANRAEIAGDDVFAFQQIAELAVKNDSDLYILGDTMDSVTNLPRPLVVARECLKPVLEKKLAVRYIQGQHEIVVQAHYDNYPWLSLIDGTEHMHRCRFELFGKKAYALDYFPESFEALNFAIVPDDTEVLFLHGTAKEVFPLGGHFSVENLPESVKFVFCGDYHVPVLHEWDDKVLIYTGSAWLQSAAEPTEKSALKVNHDFTMERIPIKTRPIYRYSEIVDDLSILSSPPDTALPEALRRPIVIVDAEIDSQESTQLAENAHIYNVGSSSESSGSVFINVAEDYSDEEILERFADKQEHPSEFEFTLDVIQNPAIDALSRLRGKLGIEDVDVRAKVNTHVDEPEINLEDQSE